MVLIRTHDSFMKIYDRKQHVLLTMETFSISAKTNQARSNGTNFVHKKVYCKNEGKQQNIQSSKPSRSVLKLTC